MYPSPISKSSVQSIQKALSVCSDRYCPVLLASSDPWKNTTTAHDMMTSSNGNIFRVTGPLCGEFTGPRWIPTQRPVTRNFDVFLYLAWINGWVNIREAGDLRRHHAHYDAIVLNTDTLLENRQMPWCQPVASGGTWGCCYQLWQPPVPPPTTKLPSWWLLVFGVCL